MSSIDNKPNIFQIGGEQDRVITSIHGLAEDLQAEIVLRCNPGREKSIALMYLENCVMWAINSIVADGVWKSDEEIREA